MIINNLITKAGQELSLGKFTILIGPNNVGKSQTLKDIHNVFTQGQLAKTVLVDKLGFSTSNNFEEFLSGLDIKPHPTSVGLDQISGITSKLNTSEILNFQKQNAYTEYENNGFESLLGNLAKFRVSYLDSESRLIVAKTSPSANLHKVSPQNLLQALYGADDEIEEKLRDAFTQTFSKDIKLDYSALIELMFRVTGKFENVPDNAKHAAKYFENYPILDEQGDGFRSFVGVVLSLLLSHDRVVLLDEPEAFLHPAQARRLGSWIAKHIEGMPGQVLISTHNSNFISGILSANQNVDIYRLNRTADDTIFTKISPKSTESLIKSPVLSSQRVLDALFHKGVVVCEADSDRVFYNTVANNQLSNQEILFIHAHNKQTVHIVLGLLSQANIPCCTIVDVDILNGKEDLNKILTSLGSSELEQKSLNILASLSGSIGNIDDDEAIQTITTSVKEFLSQLQNGEHTFNGARGALNRLRKDATKWGALKSSGTSVLDSELRTKVETLIEKLKSKGVFVVPVGELEGWIDLGEKKKNKWIVPALEHLSENGIPVELNTFVQNTVSYLNDL